MAHTTLKTFGYPDTLVREYEHWCVLLRPAQVTLGSLVMICKQDVTQFSDISSDAFVEMGQVIKDIETGLKTVSHFEKINYLMLMMVDPHVHMHVIPRYSEPREFEGVEFVDTGWPAMPQLGDGFKLEPEVFSALLACVKKAFA